MKGKIDKYGTVINGYEPHESQVLVHDSNSRFKVCVCGRRFGKTTLALNELYKWAWINTDKLARCWYVAPNYRQAKTIAWEMIKETIPEQVIASVNEAELMIRLINGTIIEVKGADAQDSLRGSKLFFVVLDEFASMKRTVWDEIIRPSMADVPNSKALFIGTPAGMHNHFKTLYDTAKSGKKDWEAWCFKTSDNPYVGREELDEIKKSTDPSIYRQEYEAEFVEMAGAIYPMFKREIHTIEPFEIPEHWERAVGLDWGMRNATAVIFSAINEKGEYFIYDVLYTNGKTVSQWADILKNRHDFLEISQWIIDPSALSQAREFGNYGIYFISYNPETLKKVNDVNIGINLMQQYLLEGKVKIFKHCDILIEQMEQYQWEPSTSRLDLDPRPKPLKKDDHSCFVAGTQIITSEGNRGIEGLKEGDLVLTRDGYKPIEFVGSVGDMETNKYLFSNGEILEATPDHPLIINNEKIPIDSLRYFDKVESWTYQTTTDRLEQNGEKRMERFLKDFTSIIRMGIQRTTNSPILNVSHEIITTNIIGNYGDPITNGWKDSEGVWIKPVLKPRNGIAQKKEDNGTGRRQKSSILENGNHGNWFVKFAISPIKRLKRQIQDFALTIVNLLFVGPLAWIISNVNVQFAQKFLKSINILLNIIAPDNVVRFIAKIPNHKKQKVYNLTVKDVHEYYANGILVSNCDALRYLISARLTSKGKKENKYKGLDPASELYWRNHNNDFPPEALMLMPKDPYMSGLDDQYANNGMDDLW